MPKNILITGGAGYIGAHTVHSLLAQDIDPSRIVIFDNLAEGNKAHLPSTITFIQGDLCKKGDIESVFKNFSIGSVLHFAGATHVGESMTNPSKYFRSNVIGGLNLLEAMHINACERIVYSSTSATYGLPETKFISEESPQSPINPYGESKLMVEKILSWYRSVFGLKYAILRFFNAAGADFGIGEKHLKESRLIPLAMDAVLTKGKVLRIFGTDYPTPDGTCIRDFIHVTDLAEAHSLALDYLEGGGDSICLNLGSGQGISVKQVIQHVEIISGKPVPYTEEPRRPGDPPMLVANNNNALELLNWKPKRKFQEIISSAWNWHTQ